VVVDEYTLLTWAQNPYYAQLESLTPLREELAATKRCCGSGGFAVKTFAAAKAHAKFYTDMQFMCRALGQPTLTVRLDSTQTTVAV